MDPLFTSFTHGDSTWEVGDSKSTSHLSAYLPSKDEWRCTLEENPKEKSFFPCPWCGSPDNSFTFYFRQETGTNTSGGTTSKTYEIRCNKCGRFTLFHQSEDSYPYD